MVGAAGGIICGLSVDGDKKYSRGRLEAIIPRQHTDHNFGSTFPCSTRDRELSEGR